MYSQRQLALAGFFVALCVFFVSMCSYIELLLGLIIALVAA